MANILVVDDEKSIRITLREFLKAQKHHVSIAETATEAFEQLANSETEIVVSDIILPDWSGVELLKKVKEKWPDIEFILMTGEPTLETASDAVRSSAFDYLSKPVRMNDLIKTVEKAINITTLRKEKKILAEENERYREDLERLVEERTGALLQSEARYRAVVEDQTDLIGRLSSDLTLSFANAAFAEFFAFNQEQDNRTGLAELFPDEQRSIVQEAIDSVRGQKNVVSFETQLPNKQGHDRWIEWQAHNIPAVNGEEAEIQIIGRDITERRLTEQKLAEHRERLTSLSLQLTVAEEQERNRIAADLHDWVGHSLALARVQLSRIQKKVVEPETESSLHDLSLTLRKTAQDVRDLIFDLSPPFLQELGLPGAVAEWLDGAISKRTLLEVHFSFDQSPLELSKETATLLYRSVRELVMNTVKHASASSVDIHFSVKDAVLHCEVRDNGSGFDPNSDGLRSKDAAAFGLFSIQERMQSLGGTMDIESAPTQGTSVRLQLPLESE